MSRWLLRKLANRSPTFRRWLASTPRRTFVLYPVLVALFEFAVHGTLFFDPLYLPLLAWGYLQYRWSGSYRTRQGGGGPGMDKPPQRLVDTGIYALLRSPMYLGHLIFMTGLVATFHSIAALGLLLFHLWWFNRRAAEDEDQLQMLFGEIFADYKNRVRRWGLV